MEFESAIDAAERAGPSPKVHPRVHQAMIEAMGSELAVLRQQLEIPNAPTTTREPIRGTR